MSRRRWIYRDGIAYEIGTLPEIPRRGPDVMPDIAPYQSMIDGSMIQSRSQHREHLRENNCYEVGNEAHAQMDYYNKLSPDVAPQQRKELIRAQVDAMSDGQFRAALKRDIDRVKWNSNDRR